MHAAKTRSHHPGGSDSPPTHGMRLLGYLVTWLHMRLSGASEAHVRYLAA